MPHLPVTMNLEDAANIGELLGGLAIVVTLIFGIRQIIELKKTKEQEATRELANLLASPMYQSGISVLVNRLSKEFALEDIGALERNEKDALNYLVITTNSIGLLTFERHLSFHAVSMFLGPSIASWASGFVYWSVVCNKTPLSRASRKRARRCWTGRFGCWTGWMNCRAGPTSFTRIGRLDLKHFAVHYPANNLLKTTKNCTRISANLL